MTSRFDICVKFVLDHETEYNRDRSVKVERDPHDPGGTTKYGIDQRSHPNIDIANLSLDAAKQIYRDGEWRLCRCENLKGGWDLATFDTAVNIGSGRAIRLLQSSLNASRSSALQVDSFIGAKTIAAVNAAALDDLGSYIEFRETYYYGLPAKLKEHYLQGWLNRLKDLRKACGLT